MRLSQFALTIFILSTYVTISSAQIMLTSQAEVDAWDQSITVLTEDVIITGSDIINIDALSNLSDITSNLTLMFNNELLDIAGLSGLTDVSGYLSVDRNNNLANINGLSNLTNISGEIFINGNAINDLSGFEGLTDITGKLTIQNNDNLENVDGFMNFTQLTGTVVIIDNESILNIDGFAALQNIYGSLIITLNESLNSIDGLSNLNDVEGELKIQSNDSLLNIDVFSGFTDISGSLTIRTNHNLTNINGLDNLTDISGRIFIINNDGLTDIDAFLGLTDLTGLLSIQSNENLTNINGLSNLVLLSGKILINANHGISNIDGLSGIDSIAGELSIVNNNGLTNINGLIDLNNITGNLEISHNTNLENIDALMGLTDITGSIEIRNNDKLTDINAFSGYMDFHGTLIIDDNDGLTNLDEFSTLEELSGSIEIVNNISLQNIDGFLGLSDILGSMIISNNDNLTNLEGLSNLSNVSGRLWIRSNSGLININGLSSLNHCTGRIDLSDNENINDLSGFSNISTLDGGLYIFFNETLTNVDGLSGMDSIYGKLNISRNVSLENINGLSNIVNLPNNASIEISDNDNLINVEGLSGITNLSGNITISNNGSLTDVNVFSYLTEISRFVDLRIFGNDALTSLDGFSNVKRVIGELRISNNNALTNIDGLSNIDSVLTFGDLNIDGNSSLNNIDGLSGLKVVESAGRVTIRDNDALENLNGFFGLENVSGTITVKDNDLLSNCCGLSDAIEIGELNGFVIDTNRVGCNSSAEILDACSLTLNYDQTRPCEGIDNGRINFFTSDFDTLPFTYQWEELNLNLTGNSINNNDQFSIENLPAGTYNVTVTLPNGAREIIQDIVLDPIIGSIFEITKLTSTNSTNGEPSGTLYLEFSGGTAPYSLSWTGPVSGTRSDISTEFYTIFGLAAGEYTIQITDANAQSKLVNITLLDEVVPIFPCTEPLDIVILNDVSGSVDFTEYNESKTFFVDLLRVANIGEDTMDSQAAIIEWSSGPQQALMVPLTGNIQALENYELATRAFNQGTSPHPAMQFGADYIEENGRDGVEKVLILSTDGNPTSSLVALADEFKARGYHIITIAFDYAYYVGNARDILTQVASISLLAPGAPSYAQLDEDLADNIINRYICPLDPGSSSSVYFNRDGSIEIDSVSTNCPITGFVEVTFTVSANRELSIPVGTSVMFYHNDPLLFGATPILDFKLPCAIPVGTSETYTVTLPINSATKLYALLNDDGTDTPPLNYPITDLEEIAYSNNMDSISICINDQPTLQALKYTTTPTPICDSILMYTIDVCNIGTTDAFDVIISDQAPLGSSLISLTVNTNNCSTNNEDSYDIPADCCVSLSLTYNSSAVPEGYYGQQNVTLSGPIDQEYVDYNGSLSSAEDVIIREGDENCPSTDIWFTKEVDKNQICEDGFLVYTYTIHNETNSVIQGAKFIDILPDPMEWVYNPYAMSGLSITPPGLSGSTAEFVIDEILADTLATFQIDAYTGDWSSDGIITTFATLENVIDLENGGIQTLASNEVSTNIKSNFPCDSLWSNTIDLEMFLSVEAFPNPTTGRIQFTNLTEPVSYKIYNSIGELYKTGTMTEESLQLDFEGINLVQLSLNSGEMKTFKLIRIESDW